ncbi:unnamed protein product [Ostreobium quekettii]|uniref:Uncharacterized protein n=1 Tax=Ostreobium quekettii TaxID=121088 RepID=A0A8S1IZM3_9CHLO|nr:unnamed protein product [Ostreobium quekettii]
MARANHKLKLECTLTMPCAPIALAALLMVAWPKGFEDPLCTCSPEWRTTHLCTAGGRLVASEQRQCLHPNPPSEDGHGDQSTAWADTWQLPLAGSAMFSVAEHPRHCHCCEVAVRWTYVWWYAYASVNSEGAAVLGPRTMDGESRTASERKDG